MPSGSKHLRDSGDLLRQAEDLRTMIARVRSAVLAGSVDLEPTGWRSGNSGRRRKPTALTPTCRVRS